jgi:hypothetical protein
MLTLSARCCFRAELTGTEPPKKRLNCRVVLTQMNCRLISIQLSRTNIHTKLIYNRRSVWQSVLVTGSHLESTTRYLFSVWQLRVSWFGAPSLTRRWVCNLLVQLLLGLARAISLGSKSHRTQIIFYYLIMRFPQPGGPGSRIYIPRNRVAQLYPRALISLFFASYDS